MTNNTKKLAPYCLYHNQGDKKIFEKLKASTRKGVREMKKTESSMIDTPTLKGQKFNTITKTL